MNKKRPKIEDTRVPGDYQSISGNSVNIYRYSKLQDEYIDYLEQREAHANNAVEEYKKRIESEIEKDVELDSDNREVITYNIIQYILENSLTNKN